MMQDGFDDDTTTRNNNTTSLLEDVIDFHGQPSQLNGVVAPLRCVQYAGDVVVVPEEWAHATLNTAPTIGVAHEVGLCVGGMHFIRRSVGRSGGRSLDVCCSHQLARNVPGTKFVLSLDGLVLLV